MADPITRDMPLLTLRAAFTPSSVNVEKRTVDMVWTTGARVLRGFWDPYWEELSLDPKHVRMGRLTDGRAPLLAAHDGYDLDSVLGKVEAARLEPAKGQGVATVRFAKAEDSPEADKAFRMVKDGILTNVSVGYRVYKLEQTESAAVREDKTEVRLAVDWEPYELSIVPMGADAGAGFRSTESRATNPCTFIPRSSTVTQEHRTMAGETQPTTPATPAAPAVPSVEDLARATSEARAREAGERATIEARALERAVAEEAERQPEIRRLVAMTDLGEEFAERCIKERRPLDEVRKAVLKRLSDVDAATRLDGHARVGAGDDASDKFVRGACASLFQRAGQTRFIDAAKKNPLFADQFRGVETDPGEFRGMRLVDLARHALELRGVNTRHLHGDALVKRAFQVRDAGMNSTSDFTTLLETAVNKIFLGAYAYTPVTWRQWCGVKSVNDFRATTVYRPGAFGVLDDVTEAGEVKHKNVPDGEKNQITPSTKGNIVGLTRKAIVNDDMGVFRDVAGGLGTAAALTIESKAYGFLTANSGTGSNYPGDTNPLFYTTRNNIGPTGAMTIATIDGARATMAKQMDPKSNMYLNLRPAVWVGPVELEGQARVFNENATDPTTNLNGVTNRVRGMLSGGIVGSAFLSAQSAYRHYFFADPAAYPVVAIGFIDGQEAPKIASEESFNFDGLQIKIQMDFGAAIIDYRGAVTCAGQ